MDLGIRPVSYSSGINAQNSELNANRRVSFKGNGKDVLKLSKKVVKSNALKSTLAAFAASLLTFFGFDFLLNDRPTDVEDKIQKNQWIGDSLQNTIDDDSISDSYRETYRLQQARAYDDVKVLIRGEVDKYFKENDYENIPLDYPERLTQKMADYSKNAGFNFRISNAIMDTYMQEIMDEDKKAGRYFS